MGWSGVKGMSVSEGGAGDTSRRPFYIQVSYTNHPGLRRLAPIPFRGLRYSKGIRG
jgi:hypothetical protein